MDIFIKNIEKEIKVCELFAGVGGFRLGLENASKRFKTVWANQWEPNKRKQAAFECYIKHFGEGNNHSNKDIALAKTEIPLHDLLVGGFPCQDYSVANTGAKGLEGKKGVLWWEINDIISVKHPSYLLLENVDRLIKSPSAQRGRDFGVMLRCLNDAGYAVEWRIINAADYGFAQRRRRIFIFAFRTDTPLYQQVAHASPQDWLLRNGFFAPSFPVSVENNEKITTYCINKSDFKELADVSKHFQATFYNSGYMYNGTIHALPTLAITKKAIPLKDICEKGEIDEKYFVKNNLEKWQYLKGSKSIERIKPNGKPYIYREGSMAFPDSMDLPARTMLTSEGSVNRSSHVITDDKTGKLRILTPVECERINGFPDNWTNTGMSERFRYFCMGNALVVPLITEIGKRILEII